MTEKEKARDLVDKFTEPTQQWDEVSGKWEDRIDLATQCAEIVVDEIIDLIMKLPLDSEYGFSEDYVASWEKVKEEINKL